MFHKFISCYFNRESIFCYEDKLLFRGQEIGEIVEKNTTMEIYNKDFGKSNALINWKNINLILFQMYCTSAYVFQI